MRNVVGGKGLDVGEPYWLNMTFSPVDGRIRGSGWSYDRGSEFVVSGKVDFSSHDDEQVVD